MTIVSIPRDVPKEEQEYEALQRFEGPSYHVMKRVPGGFGFFDSPSDLLDYEDQVLAHAAEIRKTRRDPEVAKRIAARNARNGLLSKGAGGRPKKK